MKLKYAKNPVWANRSHTMINLVVRFEEINEDLPFTATPDDIELHGRDIYVRSLAGEFGSVAEFESIEPAINEIENIIKEERNNRLAATDWTQSADVPQSTKDKWAPYRQALRDFPQQAGFPWYNQVVTELDFGFNVDVSKALWPTQPA